MTGPGEAGMVGPGEHAGPLGRAGGRPSLARCLTAALGLCVALVLGLGAAGCGQVPAPASPAVYELAPTRVHVGDTVTVDGQGFGDLQADGFVSVHGTLAEVTSWADGRIVFTVPQVPAGATVVVVSVAGRTSKPANLSVVPAS